MAAATSKASGEITSNNSLPIKHITGLIRLPPKPKKYSHGSYKDAGILGKCLTSKKVLNCRANSSNECINVLFYKGKYNGKNIFLPIDESNTCQCKQDKSLFAGKTSVFTQRDVITCFKLATRAFFILSTLFALFFINTKENVDYQH